MVTGHGTVETAVEAMRLGAFDYLTKPFELVDLQRTVNLALEQVNAQKADAPQEPAWEGPANTNSSAALVGQSEKVQGILSVTKAIADSDCPVLVEGEAGSGKQIVARTIHHSSGRQRAPFKTLQCSALPEELLEQELFGSDSKRTGSIFSRAARGTVYLEEVHLLPMRVQTQLDSLLAEMVDRRLRRSLTPEMDVRLVTSSCQSLEALVEEGKFRESLYFKLSIIPIIVPPLRSRVEDIRPIADHFLNLFAERTGHTAPSIDKYALSLLENYKWPGNVGELQNAIERACAFCQDGQIRPNDLPPKIAQRAVVQSEEQRTSHHLPLGTTLAEFVDRQEKMFITETLKFNGGSREKAASMLDVSIATLYRKLGNRAAKQKQKETA